MDDAPYSKIEQRNATYENWHPGEKLCLRIPHHGQQKREHEIVTELRRRVANELAGELSADIEGIPMDYLANHVACDFAETVRWWMRNPEYSPEDVCHFFLATTRL